MRPVLIIEAHFRGGIMGDSVNNFIDKYINYLIYDDYVDGNTLVRMHNNLEEIDNSYAMQMAQDISNYRYDKHMTGFVNY